MGYYSIIIAIISSKGFPKVSKDFAIHVLPYPLEMEFDDAGTTFPSPTYSTYVLLVFSGGKHTINLMEKQNINFPYEILCVLYLIS